jgi:hypothetical protein
MGGYGVKELLRTSLIDLWKVTDNHGSDTCFNPPVSTPGLHMVELVRGAPGSPLTSAPYTTRHPGRPRRQREAPSSARIVRTNAPLARP